MQWYYKFKGDYENSLFNNCDFLDNEESLIISEQVSYGTKYVRRFAAFPNVKSFSDWYLDTPSADRTYFESIPGEKKQKIYFDVDISNVSIDHKLLITKLKEGIIKEVSKFCEDISDDDILVFSSKRVSDKDKISYHIVLDNYYVENNIINKEICLRIKLNLDIEFQIYIDILYSTFQQFRLLFSHKSDSPERIKVLCDDFNHGKTISEEKLLLSSIISHTKHCKYLDVKYDDILEETPKLPTLKNFNIQNNYEHKNIAMSKDSYEKLIKIVKDKVPDFVLSGDRDGNFFHLRRISRELPCLQCNRTHDNENSFLFVDHSGVVNFGCFRNMSESNNRSLLEIGQIQVDNILHWIDEENHKKILENIPKIKNSSTSRQWGLSEKSYNNNISKFNV